MRLLLVGQTRASFSNGDEGRYLHLAASLYNGGGFALGPAHVTSISPPLYPWLLSFLWTTTGGPGLFVPRLVQATLSLVTALLIYVLATRMFDRRVGVVAAAIVCFYPSLLFAGLTVLTETLFTFLLVAFAVAFERCVATGSRWWAGAAGALLALAALTRSVVWLFPLAAAPLLFALLRCGWARRLFVTVVFIACNVAVLAPWAIRNTRLQGVPTVVDSMSGFNLWMANYERTPTDRMWASIEQGADVDFAVALKHAFPSSAHLTEGQKDRWGRQEALRYMWQHPWSTFRRSTIKFADFWGLDRELLAAISSGAYTPPSWARYAVTAASAIAYPLVMTCACFGLFLSVPRRSAASAIDRRAPANRGGGASAHVLIVALVLFVCAMHTIVFGHSRYRLPLMPFFFIYAGAALVDRTWLRVNVRQMATLLPVGSVCVLFGIWGRELLIRDWGRIRHLFGA